MSWKDINKGADMGCGCLLLILVVVGLIVLIVIGGIAGMAAS